MPSFAQSIRPQVDAELRCAERAGLEGDFALAFAHLERAHVLGQMATVQHVRVHWRMFVWGWRQHSLRECAGQLLRILGAATKTPFGLVPAGNTGGSNVSPLKTLPVDPELAARIERAREGLHQEGPDQVAKSSRPAD